MGEEGRGALPLLPPAVAAATIAPLLWPDLVGMELGRGGEHRLCRSPPLARSRNKGKRGEGSASSAQPLAVTPAAAPPLLRPDPGEREERVVLTTVAAR